MLPGPGLNLLLPGFLLVLLAIPVPGQPPIRTYLESHRLQLLFAEGSASSNNNTLGKGIHDRLWHTPANKETTSNLIFESIGQLLQTWGNTRRRNGE